MKTRDRILYAALSASVTAESLLIFSFSFLSLPFISPPTSRRYLGEGDLKLGQRCYNLNFFAPVSSPTLNPFFHLPKYGAYLTPVLPFSLQLVSTPWSISVLIT